VESLEEDCLHTSDICKQLCGNIPSGTEGGSGDDFPGSIEYGQRKPIAPTAHIAKQNSSGLQCSSGRGLRGAYTQSTLDCMCTRRQNSGYSPSVHFRATVRYSSRLAKPTVTQALALGNFRHALRMSLQDVRQRVRRAKQWEPSRHSRQRVRDAGARSLDMPEPRLPYDCSNGPVYHRHWLYTEVQRLCQQSRVAARSMHCSRPQPLHSTCSRLGLLLSTHPGCGGGGGGTSSALIAPALLGLAGSSPLTDTGLRASGACSPFVAGL
jgi:hypothetical protein